MEKNGKLPPQAVELEESVLGAMIITNQGLEESMSILNAKTFYKEKNHVIFQAIETIYLRDEPVDLLTLSNELKKMKKLEKVGGMTYLIQLTQTVSSAAHIEFHSRILQQKYIQRELIKNSSAIITNAYDESTDVFDLLDNAYSHLNKVSDILIKNKEIDLRALTEDILQYAGKLYRNEINPGISTPIEQLTQKMGGWRKSELIILAARPGMGKTAFALKSGWIAALQGIPVGFFSLEMSAQQLLSRLWSMDLKIDNQKFTQTGLNPEEAKRVYNRLHEFDEIPFYIDDEPALSIKTLSIKAKKWKKEKGVKMIIVDYLQLMSGTKNHREQDISSISRGLKLLAKELDIPVMALSQLSRAVEQRGGSKRPLLSDLRESGAIEQDADVVQFIYRPEYYNNDTWDDYGGVSCIGEAEYIIAKNRNGGLVRNRMKFTGRYTDFSDIYDDNIYFPMPNNDVDDVFGIDNDDDLPY